MSKRIETTRYLPHWPPEIAQIFYKTLRASEEYVYER